CQRCCERRGWRKLHSRQRGRNTRLTEQSYRIRLTQILAYALGDDVSHARIGVARRELRNENRIALGESALGEERSDRSDSERAHHHERDDERSEGPERVHTAACRTLPRDVWARAQCDRRHGSVRLLAAARRDRRRRRERATRHALHVSREQNYRQPERHHGKRAWHDPVGETDRDHCGSHHDRHYDHGDRVCNERTPERTGPLQQHRWKRWHSPAARNYVQREYYFSRALRSVVGILREAAHHQIAQCSRCIWPE